MRTIINKQAARVSDSPSAASRPVRNERMAPTRTAELASAASTQTFVGDPTISQYGSVAELSSAAATFFTLTFTPGTAAAKTYVIGDPNNVIENAFGASWDEPDASGSGVVSSIKASFIAPQVIIGVNYEVSVSSAQFANPFRKVYGDNSGASHSEPLNVQGAQRNTQYNANLLTIKFPGGIRLDQYNALTLKVNAGETVTMNFFVGAMQV